MGSTMRAVVVLFCLSTALLCALNGAEAAAPSGKNSSEQLVRQALEAGREGRLDARARLLQQALAADPDYPPARWHLGFVRIDNEWVHYDDVPRQVGDDPQLTAYRQKRDALVDTADHHRALAVWCRKNRLEDEERVHWAKVLEFDPQDAEALEALGLRLYEGRLLTREQIAQAKIAAGERLAAMRHWQPKLHKWRRAIESGTDEQRDRAIKNLRQIDDLAAIEPLEAVLAVEGRGQRIVDVNGALIETVGRMSDPSATRVLIRRAVLAESEEVRELAIAQLKKRPLYAYVPQLIAAMPGRLKARFAMLLLPSGSIAAQSELLLENKDTEYYVANDHLLVPMFVGPGDAPPRERFVRRLYAEQAERLAATQQAAHSYQQWSEQLTQRIRHVLKQTTGFADGDEAAILEQQWNDYNGWYRSPYSAKRRQSVREASSSIVMVRAHSCFPSGTPVLTDSGLVPIEDIQICDRVLSQDQHTGELSYEPVQATTLRSPTPLVTLDFGTEQLRATRGHPFWVVGAGWRVAKFLERGDRVHTLDGPLKVAGVGEDLPAEVYNLVVGQRHNYFVGQGRLLVHDNSPLEEITASVPGLPLEGVEADLQTEASQ